MVHVAAKENKHILFPVYRKDQDICLNSVCG